MSGIGGGTPWPVPAQGGAAPLIAVWPTGATQNPSQPPAPVNPASIVPPSPSAGGVQPIVEPLHQWERDALSFMANPGLAGGGGMVDAQAALRKLMDDPAAARAAYTDPNAARFMTRAGEATEAGMRPISLADVEAERNPWAEGRKTRLSEQAQEMRAQLLANLGTRGAAGFGSSITGGRLGDIDREVLARSDEIDAAEFDSAYGRLAEQRRMGMAGGQQFGNLAAGAQGIANSATTQALNPITSLFDMGRIQTGVTFDANRQRLGAGAYVRNFNQNMLNTALGDYVEGQDFPRTNVANTLTLLGGMSSGSQTPVTAPNSASRLSGALGAAGQLFGGFGGGGSPFSSANAIPGSVVTSNVGTLPWLR